MAHHEPLKALSPVQWEDVPGDEAGSVGSAPFLRDVLRDAQTVIESIPLPSTVSSILARGSSSSGSGGRSRSQTDSVVLPREAVEFNRALAGRSFLSPDGAARNAVEDGEDGQDSKAAAHAQALQSEWKEVKLQARENPLNISVYRLAAKDGKGAWFARRSVHEGISFDKWKAGLQREFLETLRGSGSEDKPEGNKAKDPSEARVRGITAERRVVSKSIDGVGNLEVYQLSAQFPGPTSPRDFVTMLVTSETCPGTLKPSKRGSSGRPPRQFMVVSKPCVHPECPQRQGFIRGHYESVEVIREIIVDKPLRRVRSSIDLSRDEVFSGSGDNISAPVAREAILRSARRPAASSDTEGNARAISFVDTRSAKSDVGADDNNNSDDKEVAIEWYMVTRSDPGGSVPRFLVEKGTPAAIVSDAGKFLKWVESKDARELMASEESFLRQEDVAVPEIVGPSDSADVDGTESSAATHGMEKEAEAPEVPRPISSGLYSIVAGALGAAGSVVASRLPIPFPGSSANVSAPDDDSSSDISDASSAHSFASAEEGSTPLATAPGGSSGFTFTLDKASTPSILSDASAAAASTATKATGTSTSSGTQHEKELRKLQERYRKIQEKISQANQRRQAKTKNGNGGDKDAADGASDKGSNKDSVEDGTAKELAKLREKHERDQRRQLEKYQKELQRVEARRTNEERKAVERARKAREKEEREDMKLALERARAERDVALKEVDVLKDTVGELQAQNTMLVARLGKLGLLADGKDDKKEDANG